LTEPPGPDTETVAKLELTGSVKVSTTSVGGVVTVPPSSGSTDLRAVCASALVARASAARIPRTSPRTAAHTVDRNTRAWRRPVRNTGPSSQMAPSIAGGGGDPQA